MMITEIFDKEIYDEEAVYKAAEAYENYGKICIENTDSSIICSFSHCIYDEELTAKEFSNYVLGCMNG